MVDWNSEWVERNREIRQRLGLPGYRPPEFSDGASVHEVISRIEATRGSVSIKNPEPTTSDTWTAFLEGEPFIEFERVRTVNGNAVFEVTADEFVSAATSVDL